MNGAIPRDRIRSALGAIVRARWLVIAAFAVLVPLATFEATRIPSEGGIDRLIVPGDPDVARTRAFHAIFPEPRTVLLVFESPDPWSAASIARVDGAEAALRGIPHVGAFSVLDALRRARPAASPAELRALATGTRFFRSQALVGPDFLTVVTSLAVTTPAARDAALAAIDGALDRARVGPVREVGEPVVSAWIEHEASRASTHSFPIFGILLVAIAFFVLRSLRALGAVVLALGAAVALGVAAGGMLGFSFTIVSVLVPLTVLVTTLATLVYLHTRFVDHPDGVSLRQHHLDALRNKFLPVTASTFAAALGFAALAVSQIRPIREMGLWTAIGLAIAWVVAFTLFPALQLVLRTPTGRIARARPGLYDRFARALPERAYRYRWPLVGLALAGCVAGAAVLFGIPGMVRGASVQVDQLSNLDPGSKLYRDLVWFRDHAMELDVARVWIHLPDATATDPDVLRALDQFDSALEHLPEVTSVVGPTTMLRVRSYLAGHGEVLPSDPEAFEALAADLEQLLLTEPELRTFIDASGLADLQLVVSFRGNGAAGYAAVAAGVQRAWASQLAASPALAGATARVVGESMLEAKVGANLVPTLAQSFVLTAALIFVVFLFVFRSGVARLLAMIPSLFALLVAFLAMRIFGGTLNVATIIIATTVLGTTENDQIHFFHHMHERDGEPLEVRLGHALRVSGRAIVFATMINAAGFLGLAVSSFPPLRQFGLMTALAFVLALAADFTALPGALWIAARRRPAAPATKPPPA